MNFSKYQIPVFNFVQTGKGNLIIQACAGSGKTTTLIEAMKYTSGNACFLAFNKSIADELKSRCPSNVTCSTIHSMGLKIINSVFGRSQIKTEKLDDIMDSYTPTAYLRSDPSDEKNAKQGLRNNLKKLIGYVKNTFSDYTSSEQMCDLMDKYDGINITPEIMIYLKYVMEKSNQMFENAKIIDFDDMIYLPVAYKMDYKYKFDFIFVDEAQDLNMSQIELILSIVKSNGRVIVVGDRRQSIYGFRGADVSAMDVIKRSLSASELPLSLNYRCPASHIEKVKKWVPEIEGFREDKGEIISIREDKFIESVIKEDNPLILARLNAILIRYALKLIAKGFKAVVRGRDFGQTLVNLVKKFNSSSMGDLYEKTHTWYLKEQEKLGWRKAPESAYCVLDDKKGALEAFYENCNTVDEVINKMEMLFNDNNVSAYVFSSVHKAKGLENNVVYILAPGMMPLKRQNQKEWELVQEENIRYVAYTRSKSRLVEVNI